MAISLFWNRLNHRRNQPRDPANSAHPSFDLHRQWGDLTYDLLYSVLWNHVGTKTLYLELWARIDQALKKAEYGYQRHSRAWVLQVTTTTLFEKHQKYGRKLSPSEQVMLDANLNIPAKLRQFDSYLHKLPVRDHTLLLLRDKYGLPYGEIATILGMPEGSLRVQHQQALRSLQEWLWDRT
ncbi:MAG: Sigma-70, region 4 [Pseudomonadota bacterium]